MSFLRQLLILALVLLTASSGMPHVACRCSNGDVHLFCPRVNQSTADGSSTCNTPPQTAGHKSCCGGEKSGCCGLPKDASRSTGAECCASGCRCTPVYLQANPSPTLKKVCLPDLLPFTLTVVTVTEFHLPRMTRVDLNTLEHDQRVPDDLIVLCQRWLV